MVFNPRRVPFETGGGSRLANLLNAAMEKRILKQGVKKSAEHGVIPQANDAGYMVT